MHITFVDDSIPFDGFSATSRPLDGPEKALVYLPAALAMRGHDVQVFNRCDVPRVCFGARWETWSGERPSATDVLIALRHPRLLDFIPNAGKRILWVAGDPLALTSSAATKDLQSRRPILVFADGAARRRLSSALDLEAQIVEPGIAPAYLEDEPMVPGDPPRAVVTVHPLLGLEWLLGLWIERIRPAAQRAELHVYSAILDRGRLGADIPAPTRPALLLAQAGAAHGVVIQRPLADPDMAEAYRAARVHLDPRAGSESYIGTLAESQAVGLPAVVRGTGSGETARIVDGQTGAVRSDDNGYASAAVDLLTDRGAFDRLSANARSLRCGRSWQVVAAEWEELLE